MALKRRPPQPTPGLRLPACRRPGLLLSMLLTALAPWLATAQPGPDYVAELLAVEGSVSLRRAHAPSWEPILQVNPTNRVFLYPGDQLRTGENTRATVRLFDLSIVRFDQLTGALFEFPPGRNQSLLVRLARGIAYLFHRDKAASVTFSNKATSAATRGTEFAVEVDERTGRMTLHLIEGEATLQNSQGLITLSDRETGLAEPGAPPSSQPLPDPRDVIQWCLYYPPVLDPQELELTPPEQTVFRDSLRAYQRGDLLQALAKYPPGRPPASPRETVYLAALLLTVGQVSQTRALLDQLPAPISPVAPPPSWLRLANALRRAVDAIQLRPPDPALPPSPPALTPLVTEWLADSYQHQSAAQLEQAKAAAALASAQADLRASPFAGAAWARLAELEFAFGNSAQAARALERSLQLSPDNPQALALRGFVLTAQNHPRQALDAFNRALAIDPALGNAWLGRGLTRIHLRQVEAGRLDLEIAAAIEPQRALLRSYLGKAFAQAGDPAKAMHELALAKALDRLDPTPWLYSALLYREQNRINESIRDLERSIDLNDNRALYRSRFRLDEDRAVRSSSLATLFQSAGMNEVALGEAARAVSYDYANSSAHLFLSDSYNALRDPARFNLRYETVWFNELLLANLLSPVGGTPLSQHISQQEYSRLFTQNRVGLVSETSYRGDGQYRETASQYGWFGATAWSIDVDYQHNHGVRPNNELDRLELQATVKQQLTWRDSILLLVRGQKYHSGDNFQSYDPNDPASARPDFFYDERQKPGAVVGGYHHEWAPGIHTLVLGGRLANDQELGDINALNYLAFRAPNNNVVGLGTTRFDFGYQGEFETYSGELNQIFQLPRHTLVLGARYQSGTFTTRDTVLLNPAVAGSLSNLFPNPPAGSEVEADFDRLSGYAYWTWEVQPSLRLTPGVSYDWIRYPRNHRHPPVSAGEEETDRVSPKAAVVWNPISQVAVRGAYTRSLGGVSYDQSYRLEPTQLAGFSQTFRSLMPESLAGSVSAPLFQTAGLGLDLKFKTQTCLTLQGEFLKSEVGRTIGAFQSPPVPLFFTPSSLDENLDYRERSVSATLNQLVGNEWSFGLRYRFTWSELKQALPEVPEDLEGAWRFDKGTLHQPSLFALYNHPFGWFCGTELSWYIQDSSYRTPIGGSPTTTSLPAEEFPQLNLLVGYRLRRQRGEIAVGGLNLTGEDYHLNPVNPYMELPRERVFYARLRFRF